MATKARVDNYHRPLIAVMVNFRYPVVHELLILYKHIVDRTDGRLLTTAWTTCPFDFYLTDMELV